MPKAIIIKKNGGPEVLELQEVNIDSPGPDEIKVTNHAIGLNYIDTYHRSGLYPLSLPSGIGLEAAGKIDEIGNRLPTENDLTTHLSTIFTENRLKKYIELRSMDTCGWDCLCAGPAFNIGLLYGNLDETYDLISNWDEDKIINAYLEAPQKGFNTQLMGKDLLYWAGTLLDISKKGLDTRDILNKKGKNETLFLNHLQNVIDNKTTNADHMINKFSKNEDLTELYDK